MNNSSDEVQFSENKNILVCTTLGFALADRKVITEPNLNCKVIFLSDSAQVLPRILNANFDLLVLDVDIEGLDCVALIRLVREQYSSVNLPILIMASVDSIEKRNLSLTSGANDYLAKPLDPIEVSLRINNHLNLKSFHKSNSAVLGDLERIVKLRTAKLDMLIDSGLMLSVEKNRARLLNHILQKGQRLLNCDGGTMYLVTKEKTLKFAVRTKEDSLPFEEIPLYDSQTGKANEIYSSTYAVIYNDTVTIDDVYKETRFNCSGTRAFDAQCGYHTVSLLTVPMAPRDGDVIGVLQYFNALDPETGSVIPFSRDIVILVEALASQAAVALDNLQLVEEQKNTIESIIRVLATAVDSKSPHTGHHCKRVPELAMMLAEAACKAKGPFADFNFKSEDEWLEFRVGAWLHDCGKLTTPEFVIEKATKLDMMYNRIHEIRMRFEVFLRDADIRRLERIVKGMDVLESSSLFDKEKSDLLSDFTFIAECNLGKEKMNPAHGERIAAIAQKTWLRNFDDRIGLSQDELIRQQIKSKSQLPTLEFLLSDKQHHIIARNSDQVPDPSLRVKMTIPEHLYNYGEIYNLNVQRGTLTTEERYKINEHVIETIKMLEQMPFPNYLKNVPEYATTHHETMDGSGYPRRLTVGDLSVPARIMAIADVFEALTSSDRPYKTPYKLSESLRILHGMKNNHHIDPDLFDLFLTSGVYLNYARKFLTADQIDEVDITKLIGPIVNKMGPVSA